MERKRKLRFSVSRDELSETRCGRMSRIRRTLREIAELECSSAEQNRTPLSSRVGLNFKVTVCSVNALT